MTTLTFTLSPSSTSRLSTSLTCLSKFSDHILLTSHRHLLTLSALNSSKSAFASVDLLASKFFDTYTFHPSSLTRSSSQPPRFSCKIQAKPFLAVFRQKFNTPQTTTDTSTVEHCEFSLHEGGEEGECRIHVRVVCKNGVVKTYRLTYEETDAPAPLFDLELARNRWVLGAPLLKAYMEHFGPRAEQLQISSGGGRAAFTSYTEKLLDNKEILKHPLQTSVSLDTEDFEEFACDDGLCVAVSLKDMKAITGHADTLAVPVYAYYSDPGRPMQIRYSKEGMECTYTLMTIGDVRSTQRAVVSRRAPAAARPPRETTHAPSVSQREASAPSAPPPVEQADDMDMNVGMGEMEIGNEDLPDIPPPRSWPNPAPQASTSQPPAPPQSTATRMRPPQQRKPSPPLPERKETVDGALFLNYDETESEEEEGGEDTGVGGLMWDTTGREREGGERVVARDVSSLGRRREGEEIGGDEGVGPTQQERIRGLFD